MADTGVRLTIKFNFGQQIRFCGWSESYDLGYADLPTAIAARDAIDAFILTRANCLGIGPIIVECLLSAFTQPLTPGAAPLRRVTLSLNPPTPPKAGDAYNKALSGLIPGTTKPYTADFAPTVYYMRVQTNLSGTPVYSRNVWLAGLPDVADETDSPRIEDPATGAAVTSFLNALTNGKYAPSGIVPNAAKNSVSIRSINRSAGNPLKPCTAWNLSVNTYTVPNHGFAVGQPILAEGMKTVSGGQCPRGRYLVDSAPDANTITLAGAGVPTAPIKKGGFRAAIVVFNAIQAVDLKGWTKRNKGRPSGLAAGRHKVALIKRA